MYCSRPLVAVQYEYRSLLASCLGSVITRSITACCSCSVVVLVVLEMLQARTHAHTHTHTHPFNGPLFRTTRVSRYQKGKTNLDFTAARDSERQWHQLGHMQVQTDSHANKFFTGRMPFLPPNQQRQSTEGISFETSVLD